jgi:nitrate/TMAO reductase-like tetraheme cytochrome c subunit
MILIFEILIIYFLLQDISFNNKYNIKVIYDKWFQGHVPKNWKKAAVLKIKNPISVSRDQVSVYSINKENLLQLRQNIKKFNWNGNVQVTIVD